MSLTLSKIHVEAILVKDKTIRTELKLEVN